MCKVGIRWSRVGAFMANQVTFYFNIKNTVESLNNLGKFSIQSYFHKLEIFTQGTSENSSYYYACELESLEWVWDDMSSKSEPYEVGATPLVVFLFLKSTFCRYFEQPTLRWLSARNTFWIRRCNWVNRRLFTSIHYLFTDTSANGVFSLKNWQI